MATAADNYIKISLYENLITGIKTVLTVSEGIVKLVGPAGSGKSALCQALSSELEESGHDVLSFFSPPESAEEMQLTILQSLGLPSNKNFTRTITQYLTQQTPDSPKLIIIFDDAQDIADDVFLSIRLLSNIQDSSQALVRLVICGDAELDKKLATPEYRSVSQYLSQSFILRPMNFTELEEFCLANSTQLNQAGLKKLFKQSKGFPGKALEFISAQQSEAFEVGIDGADKTWTSNVIFRLKIAMLGLLVVFSLPVAYILLDLGKEKNAAAIVNTGPVFIDQIVTALPPAEEHAAALVTEPELEAELAEAETALKKPFEEVVTPSREELFSTLVSAWLESWENHDVDAYLSHYHEKFRSPRFSSLALWQENRRRRILETEDIVISFEHLTIVEDLTDSVSINFWMDYWGDGYADKTLKEVRWHLQDNDWKIDLERNLEVIKIK